MSCGSCRENDVLDPQKTQRVCQSVIFANFFTPEPDPACFPAGNTHYQDFLLRQNLKKDFIALFL